MPPKQKESKKGPAYKPATPAKDIIPPSVKEPPRDQKQLKIPDFQGENQDKNVTSWLKIRRKKLIKFQPYSNNGRLNK